MAGPVLPIDELLPEIVAKLGAAAVLVLQAPTGAGKTSRVPPAVLDAGLGPVLVLEPRRLAARAAARRMAVERGSTLGEEIGYEVRFERRSGPRTRLTVVTEGVLLRRLQDDPFLERIGCLVFDEFHERSLDADLALALARRVQSQARPDLKLLLMSATLDAEELAAALGGAPVVKSAGRRFPVEIRYQAPLGRESLEEQVARALPAAAAHAPGDVLVFLPGLAEIRRCAATLQAAARGAGLAIHELYGDLPPEQQDALLQGGGPRKLILATNVAESSVTLPGVTAVIDGGWMRQMRRRAALGSDALESTRVPLSSAEQRAGRAGRLQPGFCTRLWSEREQRGLRPRAEPEILRVDLAGALLQILSFGENDPAALPWLDAPPPAAWVQARELLGWLGALEGATLTAIGRALAAVPAPPRLARLLLEAHRRGVLPEASLLAAMLSERDLFEPRAGPAGDSDSDLLDRLAALQAWEARGAGETHGYRVASAERGRYLLRARDQLARAAQAAWGRPAAAPADAEKALLRAVYCAYPDRLARRRDLGDERGLMVGGAGVRLARHSAVRKAELFACVEVDAGAAEILVRQASAVEPEWLDPSRLRSSVECFFDAGLERVVARRRRQWHDLVLAEETAPLPDAAQVEAVLIAAAGEHWEKIDPAADPAVAGFLARLRCLREWLPELALPLLDAASCRELLPLLAAGARSFAELRQAPWLEALRGSLSHVQLQALDKEAPERLLVPSGKHLRLEYAPGKPPLLKARIQDLFGLAETPRLARGRVPVLLHLLAPNGRPQQITEDLASFWDQTYATVRRELRARYPKHAWPEDPRSGNNVGR